MTEDEVDIAEFSADCGIIGTEAEARKILGAKMGGNGF